MLYLIDNYDSFTFNLVQLLGELGHRPRVVKNDATEAVFDPPPTGFVLSPGPGSPETSGLCLTVLRTLADRVPTLGVCLGHQAIAHVFGARIVRAGRVVHAKTSPVDHDGTGLFRGLPSPIDAGRYHSLVVDPGSLPAELRVTAWTHETEGEARAVMGLAHASRPIHGVQFHPESILTPHGRRILANFCDILGAWNRESSASLGTRAARSGGASSVAET